MNIMVSLVPREEVPRMWPKVMGLLEKAVPYAHGRSSLVSNLEELLRGDSMLWIVFDADDDNNLRGALTLKVIDYPEKRLLSAQLFGGEGFKDWVYKLQETLDQFGQDVGCSGMEITGREGWVKAMAVAGYKKVMVTVEKEFDNEQGRRQQ